MLRISATVLAVVAAFAAGILFQPSAPTVLAEAEPAAPASGSAISKPAGARSATTPLFSDGALQPRAAGSAAAAAAIAELLAAPSEFALHNAAHALAARSDVATLEALIAETTRVQMQEGGKRAAILLALVGRYAELDPRSALAFVLSQRPAPWQRYVTRVFTGWSIDDFDAAVAAAAGLASLEEKRAAADGIRFAHEPVDVRWLADLTARLGLAGGPTLSAGGNVAALADRDPQAAVAASRSLPPDQRPSAQFDVGRRWGNRDPEAAYRYAMALPAEPERFHLLNGLFDAWGRSNPRRVIEILETGVPQSVRDSIVNYGIANMARLDPDGTFTRLASMRNTAARDAALKPAVLIWAEENAEAAALALERLDAPGIEKELENIVGALFARVRPERALDWAQRYDGGYGTAWRAALGEIARSHPDRAMEIAASVAPDKQREVTIMVLGSITQTNPLAAAEYWERQPTDLRADGAFQIVREWVQTDTVGATNWILGRPRGRERDSALRFLADAPTLPAERLSDVVAAIDDEGMRAAVATGSIQRMLERGDRAGAEGLMDRIELPQETGERLRARIEGREIPREPRRVRSP